MTVLGSAHLQNRSCLEVTIFDATKVCVMRALNSEVHCYTFEVMYATNLVPHSDQLTPWNHPPEDPRVSVIAPIITIFKISFHKSDSIIITTSYHSRLL